MPMLVPSGEEGDREWLSELDLSAKGQDKQKFQLVSQKYGELMARLREISKSVKQRNERGGREMPCWQFDPLTLERSVSL